jgi:hypothetical protein
MVPPHLRVSFVASLWVKKRNLKPPSVHFVLLFKVPFISVTGIVWVLFLSSTKGDKEEGESAEKNSDSQIISPKDEQP